MTTTPGPGTTPLLHPRLAALDPSRSPAHGHGSRRPSRLGVLAGTIGACLTITFAAHAVHAPVPPAATGPVRPLARSVQVLVSGA